MQVGCDSSTHPNVGFKCAFWACELARDCSRQSLELLFLPCFGPFTALEADLMRGPNRISCVANNDLELFGRISCQFLVLTSITIIIGFGPDRIFSSSLEK